MRSERLIQFYMTNQCNSHCRTCSIWRNENTLELNANKVLEIMQQFPTADYVLGGGEMALYSDAKHLILSAIDMGINFTVLTNCIDYEFAKKLIEWNVPNITISCDGINHDKIRGSKGNLDNIIKFVKVYKNKEGLNLKLSYTYSIFNEDSFVTDMHFFKGLGFDKIYFCLAEDMELLQADESVRAGSFEKILKYKDMLYDKDVAFIENMCYGTKKICDSTKSVYTIFTNGDVVMCQSYMSSFAHGNIHDMSFKDIVENWEIDKRCPGCKYDEKCNLLCQRRYD